MLIRRCWKGSPDGLAPTTMTSHPMAAAAQKHSGRYRVNASDIVDGAITIRRQHMELVIAAPSDQARLAAHPLGSQVLEVEVCGDGACGVHALFGSPNSFGQLHCANARQMIREKFSQPFAALVSSAGADLVEKVVSSMWADFTVVMLERADGMRPGPPTQEQAIFWHHFQQPKYKGARDQARARNSENQQTLVAKKEATNELLNQSRRVFGHRFLSCMWQPLAAQRQPEPVLPALGVPLETLSADELLALQRSGDGPRYDWIQPPNDMLMRKAVAAGAALTHRECSCKFACLANPCPAFDSLRHSFLIQMCPAGCLDHLQQSIFDDAIIQQWTTALTPEEQEEVQLFATAQLDTFKECVITTGPPAGFNVAMWPCLERMACALSRQW